MPKKILGENRILKENKILLKTWILLILGDFLMDVSF